MVVMLVMAMDDSSCGAASTIAIMLEGEGVGMGTASMVLG